MGVSQAVVFYNGDTDFLLNCGKNGQKFFLCFLKEVTVTNICQNFMKLSGIVI